MVEMNENEDEQNDSSNNKPSAFETIEERIARRRQKAPFSRLIFYIITLILVLIIMLWLRHGATFYR